MVGLDEEMRDAIEELWSEVFGEAPAVRCEPHLLASVLIRSLSPAPPYGDPPGRRDREPLAPHSFGDVTKRSIKTN